MAPPDRKAKLFARMARLREVERQAAMVRVAEAAGLHGKLINLHTRSGEIAASYASHEHTHSGGDLAGRLTFLAGLQTILRETEGDRRKAERSSAEAMAALRLAERRRDIAGERVAAERAAAEKQLAAREIPVLARKLKG
ncbi:hypothetical protein [Altererythrobacter lauratis]|uniref:Flagellar FliJ protein n=1 Tax=Alteraurantiacibacter lauratis TaxID=2054627 RepID=A0ABV7EDK9_9SPHN